MADKFAFTMQVFFLGFSVVMLVLFLLYGLISLFNRLRSPLLGKAGPEEPPLPDDWELLPPELIAAITAAVHHYRADASGPGGPVRIQVELPQSLWAVAGRRALLENSSELERLRRKKKLEEV